MYDRARQEASFLEVNARLQVEHPVTEEVFGVDLVEQMLRLAGQGPDGVARFLASRHVARGHAVEARVYAEDPGRGGAPSPGLVTSVTFPDAPVRVDAWIEAGLEVSPHYDPMVAKIIARGADRDAALAALAGALAVTRVDGVATNLGLLRAVAARPDVRAVAHSTSTLDGVADPEPRIDVLAPGTLTTVQDWPGRLGYWRVGVPPSGPMDEVSLREANLAVGNPEGAAALEITATGPALRFSHDTLICLGGAASDAVLRVAGLGERRSRGGSRSPCPPAPSWRSARSRGQACALTSPCAAVSTCPSTWAAPRRSPWAGSAATAAAPCRQGTCCARASRRRSESRRRRRPTRQAIVSDWEIGVTEGPHAAPDFFTRADIDELYASVYTVHHNSARTGVRLIGPRPSWAREDGGEAGLHPSNIHDVPYAVGALDFTGDTPIILGPDGPSLGGFVCPAVVASGELWKTGQLRPGDTVRFVAVAGSRRGRAARPPCGTDAGAGRGRR